MVRFDLTKINIIMSIICGTSSYKEPQFAKNKLSYHYGLDLMRVRKGVRVFLIRL